jgi:hypothetical protein
MDASKQPRYVTEAQDKLRREGEGGDSVGAQMASTAVKVGKEAGLAVVSTIKSAAAEAASGEAPAVSAQSVDWSLIDAAYLITCPQADGGNPRLERALQSLRAIGLDSRTEVREFATDDEDRVRGCYTSHISVLREAAGRFKDRPKSESLNILVLEDNLSVSPRLTQSTLDSISSFLSPDAAGGARKDMVHLAYIMYVPGLSVETLADEEHVVRLRCNADSVLGTTASIISRSGLDALLEEDARTGYIDGFAIPNLMAKLFPDSRYAAFPMPLHRAATVKSLVNGQLDALRALIFQPQVYTQWEKLLVATGLSTNILFPALCVALFIGAFAGGEEAVSALIAASRGDDVSLGLPLFSAAISAACLAVLGYGLALAPQPETAKADPAK